MKKLFCSLLILTLILSFSISAMAESTTISSTWSSSEYLTEIPTESNVDESKSTITYASFDSSIHAKQSLIDSGIAIQTTSPGVLTPNGSSVQYIQYIASETRVLAVEPSILDNYNILKYLAKPNSYYNCHSYAWHSQNIDLNYHWISWPIEYIVDGSYVLVTGNPQPGDIACYYDEDAASGEELIHSGIVVKIAGTSGSFYSVTLQSKWGSYGMYEHRGDQCPYYDVLGADYLVFYRRSGHSTHSFSYSQSLPTEEADVDLTAEKCHKKYCTGCGVTIWEEHKAVTYTGITSTSHTGYCICGASMGTKAHQLGSVVDYDDAGHVWRCACGYQVEEPHHHTEYTAAGHTGECNICDYVAITTEAHTIVYSNNGDGTHTRACTGCEYSATELHDCVYTPIDIYGHDAVCQYCSYEVEDEAHSWDDGYDAEGNQYNYCTQCGYESDYVPMTAEMIAALSLEEQRALIQSIQTANSEFVLYLDAERGVLYQDGVCYLFYVPANVEVSVYLQPIDLATTQPVYPLPEVTE